MGFARAQPNPYALRTVRGKARRDFGERRARAIFGWAGRPADMDEARDALVRRKPERIEHGAVISVPFRDPVGGVTQRVRGGDKVHRRGAGGQHLLPFGNFHMRRG